LEGPPVLNIRGGVREEILLKKIFFLTCYVALLVPHQFFKYIFNFSFSNFFNIVIFALQSVENQFFNGPLQGSDFF